jgi:hypothetical protein
MHDCIHFNHFMQDQLDIMKKSIDENKWYLSEKAMCDIGYSEAEKDFLEKYMELVAVRFRRKYCGEQCEDRHDCNWKEKIK